MAGVLVLVHRVWQTEDEITYNSALRARGPWRDAQFLLGELVRNGLALELPLAWLLMLVASSKSGSFAVSSSKDIIACNTVLEGDRLGLKWQAVCLLLDKMNIAALCLQWKALCVHKCRVWSLVGLSVTVLATSLSLSQREKLRPLQSLSIFCLHVAWPEICLGATNSSTCRLWAEAWDLRSKSLSCIARKPNCSVKSSALWGKSCSWSILMKRIYV